LDDLPERELVVALAALSQQPDSDSASSVDEPAYLVLDGHGLVTSANVTARRILRTPHEQIVGYPLADFGRPVLSRDGSTLQPDDHPGEVTRRTGRAVNDCVVGIRRPDGNRVWLSVTTRALHFEGRYLNTVVFIAELAMTSDGEPAGPGRQSSPDATTDEFAAPP
jgi:PAS domain-containing protein